MTTTNGNSQGRITEHVEGVVASSNERGVKLVGEEGYPNFSKYAEPLTPPARGTSVRLGLDASSFVRTVQQIGTAPSLSSSNRDSTITRLSVLKTAAAFLGQLATVHEGVKSDHVIPLAERWLRCLESVGEEE